MDSSRQYSLVKETKCRDDAGVVMLMKEPRGVVTPNVPSSEIKYDIINTNAFSVDIIYIRFSGEKAKW